MPSAFEKVYNEAVFYACSIARLNKIHTDPHEIVSDVFVSIGTTPTIEQFKEGIRHYCNKNKFNFLSRSKKILPGVYGIDRQCIICKEVLSHNHFRVMTKKIKDIPCQFLDSYCKKCRTKYRREYDLKRCAIDAVYRDKCHEIKKASQQKWLKKNRQQQLTYKRTQRLSLSDHYIKEKLRYSGLEMTGENIKKKREEIQKYRMKKLNHKISLEGAEAPSGN